ncbi:MAG: DUF1501 domain-containing protein [Gemmataceae bacterium]|nr:DUF1501 domain-containing protein [Gemmataceae bacterium]
MIRILGSPHRLCDGLTRRDFLHVGGLGVLGLGLSDFFRLQQVQATVPAPRSFGRTRACILLFPYGSPPQHETFDPKPDAPVEVRGEMGSIETRVPGLRVCADLPRVARVMDRVTVVRSMTHPYPLHCVAYVVSGLPTYTTDLETRARDSRHWPFVGSVVDYLEERRAPRVNPTVPRNVALPWMLNSRTDLLVNAGPFAAFLGQGYDPVWTDFDGPGTRLAPRYTERQQRQFLDPFGGTTPAGRFRLATGADADVPVERLNLRRGLLEQLDRARARLELGQGGQGHDRFRQMAFTLLTSSRMRQALDIGREPALVRERYGMTLFGQACLAARRLVEAGCKFVTVFWDGYGQFANCAWDTHSYHFQRLREYLLPGFDLAYSALLEDLEGRGLLDETLVLWMSEHGRTPQIDPRPAGAGRHHWSRAYSAAFAGGGVARGRVVGSTDRLGGDVRETPVSPKDILATTFHLLGIDPHTTVPDLQGRPVLIAGDGEVRRELLA